MYALSAIADPVSLSHKKGFLGTLEEYCLSMEVSKRLLNEAEEHGSVVGVALLGDQLDAMVFET